jgi:GTP-binding protein HflX
MIERKSKAFKVEPEKAILVSVCSAQTTFEQAVEYLDELAFLAETAGAVAVGSFIQRLPRPLPGTYIGSGKIEEVKNAVIEREADMVIFDDDLSPSQIRNLTEAFGEKIKLLDRSSLILYIFSERAQTAQARVQVDLAQYQYLLPRLTGMWQHLSRQRGGIGLKGAGEKEIETDRRIINDKIAQLKKELKKFEQQSITRRKHRVEMVRVALVGYTNVGKSTLMNLLSKSTVLAENKLFATLDTTVRKVYLGPMPFLLSDTVGFIRKLPHHLVESFKSTLAEAAEADILLHVVDTSHPQFLDQMAVVNQTLQELKIKDKVVITVFNKIDLLDDADQERLQETWFAREHAPAVTISAGSRVGIDAFRTLLKDEVLKMYRERYPYGAQFDLTNYDALAKWQEETIFPETEPSDYELTPDHIPLTEPEETV